MAYNLQNIRTLLTEGFADTDLRRFCFEEPAFRPVYDQLAGLTGKAAIIDLLLEYADRTLQIEQLLAWAKKQNPSRYQKHEPYYLDTLFLESPSSTRLQPQPELAEFKRRDESPYLTDNQKELLRKMVALKEVGDAPYPFSFGQGLKTRTGTIINGAEDVEFDFEDCQALIDAKLLRSNGTTYSITNLGFQLVKNDFNLAQSPAQRFPSQPRVVTSPIVSPSDPQPATPTFPVVSFPFQPRIFLCHAREDKLAVHDLYHRLCADGLDPWLDEEKLLPGQNWRREITQAVHNADIVIVCLSENSIKGDGYIRDELAYALDIADKQPEDAIFIIPVRLEECDVPERLRHWHWVNLFEATGYERLLQALQLRAQSLRKSTDLKSTILKFARDPIWQMIGVVIAIIGVAWPVYTYFAGEDIPTTSTPTAQPSATIAAIATQPLPVVNLSTPTLTNIPPTLTPTVIPTNTPVPATNTPTFTSTPTNIPLQTSTPKPPTNTSFPPTIIASNNSPMVLVPAGPFEMGSNQGENNKRPAHEVTLSAFSIDQYEVTNAQYAAFVQATNYQTEADKDGGFIMKGSKWEKITGVNWQHPTGLDSNISQKDNHPVVQVSWNDAMAYCEWRKGRLPTEAEWEKAARGTDGRAYPWGNQAPDVMLLNSNFNVGDTKPVGSYPQGVSPYGVYDMSGNVWEWVADWYDEEYYSNSPAENPLGPSQGNSKALRGAAWNDFDNTISATGRNFGDPSARDAYVGFRCAMAATP